MKQKHLYQPFEIHVSNLENWIERPLTYHFFEIVQILDGEGARIVNDNTFEYKKGSIFLFTPLDCRGFESRTQTRFCSIRFAEVFLGQYKSRQEKEKTIQWLRQLESIFTHHNRFEQLLIHQRTDCQMVASLIVLMIDEYNGKQLYFEENLQYLVTLVLNIISRNIPNNKVATSGEKADEPLINRILVYLHQYISTPQKMRIKSLSRQFNLSENYIGEYFKKLTGDSLHCYITQYRMNMIEQRLTYSDYPIGRIADEFGFSDESHLSRQFKKHKGITPVRFRQQERAKVK